MKAVRALAEAIAGADAQPTRKRIVERLHDVGERASDDAVDLAALVSSAYPALALALEARPEDAAHFARGGAKAARDHRAYKRIVSQLVASPTDEASVRNGLRVFARREKMRVAVRELLPHAGSDVDVTSRELSDLADVCLSVALREALAWAEARFGVPRPSPSGDTGARQGASDRIPFVVIGMGKLGGRELNCGSDVDLLLFYETDDGAVWKDGVAVDTTLHDFFTRVAQRFITTLEEPTSEGIVWRVDMRLRPEGSRGPLVNALAAAERYYETWGRTWERAALLRARPAAGDLAFGARLLSALSPFVWRRAVDPRVAVEMTLLARRARVELSLDPERDLKLGPGGIREVEFFTQSLQLIWGGRDPSIRTPNTLDALRKLRARGLVTDREGQELGDSYLFLRRLEHRVQFATGLQTHTLPPKGDLLSLIARSLGFGTGRELQRDLDRVRKKVATRFQTLAKEGPSPTATLERAYEGLFVALDASSEPDVVLWLEANGSASPDVARHLLTLARRPDAPLGASTRDKFPEFAPVLITALLDAADPEQATRLLAAFFARLLTPTVYARALAEDARATRRLAALLGASAFLGEAMVGHPELADRLLFGRGAPDPASARRAVEEEIVALGTQAGDAESVVGALRRAKGRIGVEVGLADLAGEGSTRSCTLTLSELADATLEAATQFALAERGLLGGLAVMAMGKLGGREIGYGSDLDLFFVYEDDPASEDASERYIRIAQRVLRLLSTPHGDGPGYDLDTRLRPSGNQGLLVVSRQAFARYHARQGAAAEGGTGEISGRARSGGSGEAKAEDWERQALLKARVSAGDGALGRDVLRVAHEAAYERGAPAPQRVHHVRMRMEKELAGERRAAGRARYDLKLGRGGLVDVEFAVQWLQMRHGLDARVRTTDTESALDALEACGYLDPQLAAPLREGYRFLRRLEQRLRVLHGTSAQLIEEGAPGLAPLARRMGMRDGPHGSATVGLLERYVAVTEDVRAAYLAVLGMV